MHALLPKHDAIDANAVRISKLFATPLASIELPDHAQLNAELRDMVLGHVASQAGVQHSNEGGWQSECDFLDWSGPAGAKLVEFARAFADALTVQSMPGLGLVHAQQDWKINGWANVNERGDSNLMHGHPGAYWSAVYWIDDGYDAGDAETDVGGLLEFADPRGIMPALLAPNLHMRIEGCLTAGLGHTIRPQTGTLVFFPAWLLHAVTRYEGSRPRISVALNFTP